MDYLNTKINTNRIKRSLAIMVKISSLKLREKRALKEFCNINKKKKPKNTDGCLLKASKCRTHNIRPHALQEFSSMRFSMGKPMNQVQTLVDNNMNPFLKKRKNNTVKSKKEKKIFESHKKINKMEWIP